MMNRPLGVSVLLTLLLASVALAEGGAPFALLVNGKALAPVRAVGDWLGGDVRYERVPDTVIVTAQDLVVVFHPQDRDAVVNDTPVAMDIPATVYHGRLYVPVRFIANTFDAELSWDAARREVVLTGASSQALRLPAQAPESPETSTSPTKLSYILYSPRLGIYPPVDSGDVYHAKPQSLPERPAGRQMPRKASTSGNIGDPLPAPGDINTVDGAGKSPLYRAVWAGNLPRVNALLDMGAELAFRGPEDDTLLHAAMKCGDSAVVKLLIDKGLDVNARDKYGRTPLFDASFFGKVEIVKLLLDAGAHVNARDNGGSTPLFSAVSSDQVKIIELLVSRGADINARRNWDITPLHHAAITGLPYAVEKLITLGANVNARDKGGVTPMGKAKGPRSQAVIAVLQKYGGAE